MKKSSLMSIATLALGAILFALPALATTTASITPTDVKIAEQVKINYPADLLQVTSFNIGSSWMSLTQPGYDSIDNVNGVLTKTAGYAGGITSQTPFGTITFTAMKSGSGAITIGNGSQAFQKSGQTAMIGTGASVVVTAATVVPNVSPKVTPKASVTNDLTPVTTINGEVVSTTPAQAAAAAVSASQVAAVNASGTSFSGYTWFWILLIIVILGLIGWWMYSRRSGPKY
jgi:cobalamin biosynthesis Mg chelatase CobN